MAHSYIIIKEPPEQPVFHDPDPAAFEAYHFNRLVVKFRPAFAAQFIAGVNRAGFAEPAGLFFCQGPLTARTVAVQFGEPAYPPVAGLGQQIPGYLVYPFAGQTIIDPYLPVRFFVPADPGGNGGVPPGQPFGLDALGPPRSFIA